MAELDQVALEGIAELLRSSIGLSSASVGRRTLEQAVQHRMKEVSVPDARSYLWKLQSEPRELQSFVDEIVVPESWFFREVTPFECLRLFCRARLAEGPGRKKLRLLSVPCSRGEEPYSMAMTLLDMGVLPEQFEIVGCDVSSGSLDVAKRGLYRTLAFRERTETTERLERKHFHDEGGERRLDASVRALVHFRRENLSAVDFLKGEAPFDVVFCRNLLIYLTEEARKIALSHLGRLLAPGGLLYFGHSECRHGRQMGLVSWHGQFPASFSRQANTPKRPTSPGVADARRPSGGSSPVAKNFGVPGASDATAPLESSFAVARTSDPQVTAPKFTAPKFTAPKFTAPKFTDPKVTDPTSTQVGAIAEGVAKARDLADRGLLQEAESCCQRLQATHRFDPDVLCLRGVIKQASGEMHAAEQFFQQALFVVPDHREALTHLMLLSKINGNAAQAANYQRRLDRIPARDTFKP